MLLSYIQNQCQKLLKFITIFNSQIVQLLNSAVNSLQKHIFISKRNLHVQKFGRVQKFNFYLFLFVLLIFSISPLCFTTLLDFPLLINSKNRIKEKRRLDAAGNNKLHFKLLILFLATLRIDLNQRTNLVESLGNILQTIIFSGITFFLFVLLIFSILPLCFKML